MKTRCNNLFLNNVYVEYNVFHIRGVTLVVSKYRELRVHMHIYEVSLTFKNKRTGTFFPEC